MESDQLTQYQFLKFPGFHCFLSLWFIPLIFSHILLAFSPDFGPVISHSDLRLNFHISFFYIILNFFLRYCQTVQKKYFRQKIFTCLMSVTSCKSCNISTWSPLYHCLFRHGIHLRQYIFYILYISFRHPCQITVPKQHFAEIQYHHSQCKANANATYSWELI